MKTMKKISIVIYGMIFIFFSQDLKAQWQDIKTAASDTDLMRVTNQDYQSYKGVTSAPFIIQAMVEKRGKGKNYNIMLRTQNISMEKSTNYSYTYKPGLSMKNCIYGELIEKNVYNFSSFDIGVEAFEQIRNTATATFDFELLIWIKDKKYRNDGYRSVHVIKDVKANGIYWSEKEIEGDFDISEVKIVAKKINSFKANESAILPAIEAFVKVINDKAEADCKKASNKKAEENIVKQKHQEVADAKAKESDKLRAKLSKEVSIKTNSKNMSDNNDFWSGANEKTINKESDDFWSGSEEKKAVDNNNENQGEMHAIQDAKARKFYLQDSDGNNIKEWSMDDYNDFVKLDKEGNYFKLLTEKGSGFQKGNKFAIVNKKGNKIRIDNEELFGDIIIRDEGGYNIIIYSSESLYNDEVELGDRLSDSYSSSSEAISDLETYKERKKDEIRRKRSRDTPGTTYFTNYSNYNVIQAKEIIANVKMEPIITKTVYKIK